MTPLKIGVFGCGHLGRIHARLVRQQPHVELVGVCDTVSAASAAAAGEFQTRSYSDPAHLAEHIDAAIVATPTVTHHGVAEQLLRRGIPCLVEKPICTTLDQADELIRLADQHDVVLQVGHVERFNPAWQATRPHLVRPRLVTATRASGYSFRGTDVGVVLDLMIHDLDLVLSLIPEDVVAVQAWGQTVVGPHEDVAQARLEFADGSVAQLAASRVSFQPQRSMQVYCQDTHAAIDFAASTARIARRSPRLAVGGVNADRLTADERNQMRERFFQDLMPIEDLSVTPGNAIAMEQADFLLAIRSGGSPQVTGADARHALAVAQAIQDQLQARPRRLRRAG